MEFAARIVGTGSAFPERRMTNDDIAQELTRFGLKTNNQWIIERTGIIERRISNVQNEAETNSSLGARAAQIALERAGRKPEDIDQIIYATCSPDTLMPSTACWLQQKIGARRAWAMDINAACSGFIYGVVTAEQFILSGHSKTVLVVGGEVLSQLVNWQDRTICILFGDGAGAVIVKPSEEPGILTTHLCADGQYKDLLYYPVGASNQLEKAGTDEASIMMTGKEVFKVAVSKLGDIALQALESAGVSKEELDWLVPHQANIRIIQATAKRLGLPLEKVIVTVQDHGNTSAASVPMALDVGIRDGRIKPGQLVLMEAFGGGFTWGSVLMRL